jgi:hypothetical protein
MIRIVFKIIVIGIIIGGVLSFGSCKNQAKKPKDNNPVVLQTNGSSGIYDGVFDILEIEITPSPDKICEFVFPKKEQVVDYCVSPEGATVAVLTEQQGEYEMKFWSIETNKILDSCFLPKNFKAETIVWHPMAIALFALGTENASSCIYRIEKTNRDWAFKQIFTSSQNLKNMVVCPQPFITDYDSKIRKERYAYRLFLGMDNGNKTYRIVSVTENGQRFYQVVGPEKTQTKADDLDADADPSTMKAAWALPVAFHPAGHQLIWRDQHYNFFVATYDFRWWGESKPIKFPIKNKETVIPTPNGLGMISWQKNTSGIEIYTIPKKSTSRQLSGYRFESAPISVPDGKGIVGKTVKEGVNILHYLPVNMPLHNVLNAWMFINSAEELDIFQKQFGLFRPTNHEQLYELYETENYQWKSEQTRPYLITTDIFCELFAAAYQGIFIVKERDEAIPNFWQFVNEASNYFKTNQKSSKWNNVFTTLQDLKANRKTNETINIINETNAISEVTQEQYAYSDLKPRGHYTSSSDMQLYFKAFRYFTTILLKDSEALSELENLPQAISQYAINWINSYSEFIAPTRSSLVWKNLKTMIPKYCQYPKKEPAIFPLSWGFDNEILYRTVYHEDWAEDMRIEGINGKRFLPSGLDIAAVLGNGLAENLMVNEYAKYPPLRKMITNLRENFNTHSNTSDFKNNLYNQWINAMAVQWADTVNPMTGTNGKAIWQVKRLQTGLATWATLRHATVLVNERTVSS